MTDIDTATITDPGAKKSRPKPPEPAPKAEKKAFMYLGPNLPGGILFNGSLFRCGSPGSLVHLKETFKKLPEIKALFVEVKNVPDFIAKLSEQGTEAYRLYQATETKIREGVMKNVI